MIAPAKERKTLTIYDVARVAGTSKSTAARAFDAAASVKPSTRKAVLDAAAQLGFEMDPLAQRLASGRYNNTIDLFVAEFDFGMVIRKVKAIQHLLAKRGFEVAMHSHSGPVPHHHSEAIRKLCRRAPRAIVCNSWRLDEGALQELRTFQDNSGVVTCFCYGSAVDLNCDQVIFDEEDNTYQATRHFLELGHTKIGFSAHGDTNPEHPRILGVRRALAEKGLQLRDEWTFFSGIYEDGGAQLAQRFLELAERPTALSINNDVSAATFVHHVIRAGLRVPQDISIIGFDDTPAASNCMVPLTTVSQPIWWDAEHLVDMLCDRLKDDFVGEPRKIRSKGVLEIRSSTAPPHIKI